MNIKHMTAAFLAFSFAVLLMAGGCGLKNNPTSYGQAANALTSPTATATYTFTATPIVPTPTPTPVTIATITAANFNQVVLNSPIPVMVYCTASWCGVCAWMDPYVTLFAQDNAGLVKVVKVDCSNGTPAFVNTYGVPGYPTSLFFKNGVYKTSVVGGVDNLYLDTTLASL